MKAPTIQKITPARLDWSSPNTPFSIDFKDIYHSESGGQAEANHVYIEANNLPHRWKTLTAGQSFVICETGFGTGLNFLVAADCWKRGKADGTIHPQARLQFVSVEKHPLTLEDITASWQHRPEFSDVWHPLLSQYPAISPGYHRLHGGDIELTLIFADATAALNSLIATVDCWFLDGFSPAKNPDMWQQPLFEAMARLSHSTTTVSTFTVAQQVKEGLSRAGFDVQKVPGFGLKMHTLVAQYRTKGPVLPANKTPWFDYAHSDNHADLPIAVIGAGVAGCSTAHALVRRGYLVDIIERQDFSAGMPPITIQGVLYVKLSASYSPHSEFYAQGFLYSAQSLNEMSGVEWQPCGVIQTAFNDTEYNRQLKFLENHPYPETLIQGISAQDSSDKAGIPIQQSGLYFPRGGWVNPISLCQNLMSGSTIIDNTQISDVANTDQGWIVTDVQGNRLGPYHAVVVACSFSAQSFSQLADLPTATIRGQKTFIVPPDDNPLPIKTVLCGSAYIAPMSDQSFNFGATFHKGDPDTQPRDSDNAENRDALLQQFPALAPWLNMPVAFGIVGFRCTSSDYMPLVGPVPDWVALRERFARVGRYRRMLPPTALPATGLYCNLGHGSRGLSSALLSGEIIASQMSGEPLPVSRRVADHLHPARFAIKEILK